MRTIAVILITILAAALTLLSPAAAAPVYSLNISPSVPVNQGTVVTLTLSISNGQNNQAYSVAIKVEKPNGTGQATTSRTIGTDNRGIGTVTLQYPDPSFTPTQGTVNTDVGGVYTVNVNQTAPSFTADVATGQFIVISQLTVVLSQPATGTHIQRGELVTISATVSSPSGPVDTATVYANTPPNGKVYLQQIGNGVYSVNYQVQMYDPLGLWTIQLTASSPGQNTGVSNTANVTIAKSDILVEGLATYNSKGTATSTFSPGDTIVPFFRVKYSNGQYITTGQFRVAIQNPSGKEIANLTAAYDTSKFGFDSPSGYSISVFDPSGSWTVSIDAGTASDAFGNTGPNFTTSLSVQVVAITSPWGYLPFLIGGLAAVLSGVVVTRKYGKSTSGFEYIEEMMGGPIPRASSVLILGDPGSGKSILSYQFLYDELENGHYCALLSYDVFPEDIQARMKEFGWEITSHLRKNRLKIVDCYSGLAGEGEGAIKDPSDLTELNIRVTSLISRAKGAPVTLLLDSLTPIFNGVEGKQAVLFLQTVAAKIKKTGGIFYMTGSSGAIPNEFMSKIRSMVDGLIELSLVRDHRKISRYLTVVKMERRSLSAEAVPFTIDRRRGVLFQVSRLKSSLFRKHEKQLAKPTAAPALDSLAPNLLHRERGTKHVKEDVKPRLAPTLDTPTPNLTQRDRGIMTRLRRASDRFWKIPSPNPFFLAGTPNPTSSANVGTITPFESKTLNKDESSRKREGRSKSLSRKDSTEKEATIDTTTISLEEKHDRQVDSEDSGL